MRVSSCNTGQYFSITLRDTVIPTSYRTPSDLFEHGGEEDLGWLRYYVVAVARQRPACDGTHERLQENTRRCTFHISHVPYRIRVV